MISLYNRTKITAISFISIVLVVMIHSYYNEGENYPLTRSLQVFSGTNGLASVAVPMFFTISGFLFFNGVKRIKDCFEKQKKRVRTVLLPYLIWNVVFVLWYTVLENIPAISDFINSNIYGTLKDLSFLETIGYLYINPSAFHLWFLRNLIIFIILSPILFVLIKYFPWPAIAVIIVASPIIKLVGLQFFVIGGIIACHYNLEQISSVLNRYVCCFCVIIYLYNSFLQTRIIDSPILTSGLLYYYFYIIACYSGMVVLWRGYDFVCNKFKIIVKPMNIFSFTFFIYLFHEPTFNIIKKLTVRLVGISDVALCVLYLLNIILIILVSYAAGRTFKRCAPRIYAILTGGR